MSSVRVVPILLVILPVMVWAAPGSSCTVPSNVFAPFRCAEPDRIAAAGNLVERTGDELRLRTQSGIVRLDNRVQCGDDEDPAGDADCMSFVYVAHIARHHGFLVLATRQGGYGYRWIDDRNGTSTPLEDEPHFSPDGRRFAIVRDDETGGFCGIEIWTTEGPTREWRHESDGDLLYRFLGWPDEATVALQVSIGGDRSYADHRTLLTLTPSGWALKE